MLAACGGGGGAAGAEPASAVPAGTAIYFEGVVRPEGDQRDDVLDAARKVLRTDDPEAKLRELIDKGLADSDRKSKTTYEDDIAPWLGEKAGVWVAGVDQKEPGYVVLVAAKDTEAAQEAIDKGVKSDGGKVKERSYSGVDYQVDDDGVAAGIVGDFFTVGTEAEFKRTIKAQDGDSLAEAKKYKETIDGLDDDRIGQFYIDLKPFIEQSLKSDPEAAKQLEQVRSIFPIDKLDPIAGALLADGDRIAFDSITHGPGVKALKALGPLTGTGSTPLLGELPGDAWVAMGAADVGPSVKTHLHAGRGRVRRRGRHRAAAVAVRHRPRARHLQLDRRHRGVRPQHDEGGRRRRARDRGAQPGEHEGRVRQARRAAPEPGRPEGDPGQGQGGRGRVPGRRHRRSASRS